MSDALIKGNIGSSQANLKKERLENRNIALDVIRAFAVLLVIVNHIYPANRPTKPEFFLSAFARRIIYVLNTGGWIGVDLFFVLSGFLVSGLLFQEYKSNRNINAKKFLLRRGFKIYPSFFLFILITFLIDKLYFTNALNLNNSTKDFLKDLFFLHNYFGGRWAHTWSLDVEEAFYFILVVLFFALFAKKRIKFKPLLITYLLLLSFGIISRSIANFYNPVYSFDLHFGKTHFRLDALFCGVLLSYLYNYKKDKLMTIANNYRGLLILLAITLLLPNFIFPYWTYKWISVLFLAINPISFAVLITIVLGSKNSIFKNKFLSFIGKNSYCIYLWHVPINFYLLKLFSLYNVEVPFENKYYWLIYIICFITLSFGIGIFFTEVVEKPFLRFRDKAYPPKINVTTRAGI